MENIQGQDYFRIGRVKISVTNPKDAEKRITQAALEGKNGYICVSNVRTVYMANHDNNYLDLMNNAFMCTPDGMPLTWMARLWGLKEVQRTDGPDLFMSFLNKPESHIKHFFLGDTDETLRKMEEKYPNAIIVGTYSPPFSPLEDYNLENIANIINESGANIVWLSLRSPKQDYLAQKLNPLLQNKICIGVGAAFRFALGEYKHPNKTVQKMGLTGFFWRKIGWKEVYLYIIYVFNILKWGASILFTRFINLFRKRNN